MATAFLHPALTGGRTYLAPLAAPAPANNQPVPAVTIDAATISNSRVVTFGGGTRVVTFEGGTKIVSF